MHICGACKAELEENETYEYRGAFACAECFDEVIEKRDFQRNEIIAEEAAKTEKFRGLDFGNNQIGKANREMLAPQLEIAAKESVRLKDYEGRGV